MNDPPRIRRRLIRYRLAVAMIDAADPDFVAPYFGTDEAVLQHPLRLVFGVHIGARVDGHDERKRPIVPIKMNAIFATKSHTPENKTSATNSHDLIRYVFAQIPKFGVCPGGLRPLRTGGGRAHYCCHRPSFGSERRRRAGRSRPRRVRMAFANQVLARLSDRDLALL